MRFTTEEMDALEGMYEKYKALCKFTSCSDCPMDYVIIDNSEHCLEKGCLLSNIEHVMAKYK